MAAGCPITKGGVEVSTQNKFAGIQQLGRALMLPIAVLPVAGLLLRLGQPDLLNIKVMAQAGDAIFGNLALIFAIGVAVGFARDNNGAAGLAGAIGYMVLTAVLKVMPDTLLGYAGFKSLVHLDAGQTVCHQYGVLAGILSGLVAGVLYNRYKDIKLPTYLAFFGGQTLCADCHRLCHAAAGCGAGPGLAAGAKRYRCWANG
jgi:PTS system N-acetylglucosamine-specific IIC component